MDLIEIRQKLLDFEREFKQTHDRNPLPADIDSDTRKLYRLYKSLKDTVLPTPAKVLKPISVYEPVNNLKSFTSTNYSLPPKPIIIKTVKPKSTTVDLKSPKFIAPSSYNTVKQYSIPQNTVWDEESNAFVYLGQQGEKLSVEESNHNKVFNDAVEYKQKSYKRGRGSKKVDKDLVPLDDLKEVFRI